MTKGTLVYFPYQNFFVYDRINFFRTIRLLYISMEPSVILSLKKDHAE